MLARMWVIALLTAVLAAGCGTAGDEESARPAASVARSAAPTPRADTSAPVHEAPAAPAPDTDALRASATQFVENFYGDLDGQQFAASWRRLSAQLRASMGPFDAWREGYASTVGNDVSDVDANLTSSQGAEVTAILRASDIDACADTVHRRFRVRWTLGRAEGRWVATAVAAKKVAGHEPVTDTANCGTDVDGFPTDRADDYTTDLDDYGEDDGSRDDGVDEEPCIDSCDGPGPVGNGTLAVCSDGSITHSGGRPGACSHHGGLAGGSSAGTYDVPDLSSSSAPSTGSGTVHVDGYFRKDGTYVRPHTRRAPRR